MSDIWSSVNGRQHISQIQGRGYRLVESQESVATTEIVSSLQDQVILESMLDQSKPTYAPDTESLHYLLSTPFRYPPIRHGSRFGGRFEPSLFYGGSTQKVTLCESAFYRFHFYHDMETPPPKGWLRSQHSLFEFRYRSDQGIQLQNKPFDDYRQQLRHPADYSVTQRLGKSMRDAGVSGFEYHSARDSQQGINIALFDPTPFQSSKPYREQQCLCYLTAEIIEFSIDRQVSRFELEQFLLNGVLPLPAA